MQKKSLILILSIIILLFIAGCSLDTSNCNQYENSIFNLYERDSCWSQKAEETGNAQWCNEQEGSNNYCVAKVAHKKGDSSICRQYATDVSKCMQNLADFEFDDKVAECRSKWGDSRKTSCLVDLAVEEGKPSACNDAPDRVECLAKVATLTNDASICDQAGEERSLCIQSMGVAEPEENEEQEIEKALEGECKYDSDCPTTCDEDGYAKIKFVCNGRTNKCEKGFETDCRQEKDQIDEEFAIPRACSEGKCVFDKEMASAVTALYSQEVKDLLATNQKLIDLMLETNKNCLNGLADVTNQLILDTASLAGAAAGGIAGLAKSSAASSSIIVSGSSVNLISEATIQAIDGLAGATPSGTSPADFISFNCNLYKKIPDEIEKVNAEIEKKQARVKAIKDSAFMNK